VKLHPGPPSSVSRGRPTTLEGGPDSLSAVHNLLRHVT
jgi:hypothetical protein